jgi:phage-related baseplate assembly protein
LKAALKKDVKRSEIITIIYSTAGVANVELTSPAADITLAENEWSNCTNKTVNPVI